MQRDDFILDLCATLGIFPKDQLCEPCLKTNPTCLKSVKFSISYYILIPEASSWLIFFSSSYHGGHCRFLSRIASSFVCITVDLKWEHIYLKSYKYHHEKSVKIHWYTFKGNWHMLKTLRLELEQMRAFVGKIIFKSIAN